MNKNIIIIISAIILTGVISFVIFNQLNKNEEMKKLEESIENIETKVQALFKSTEQDELSEDINNELISEIKVLLGHVQDKEMKEELSARYEAARESYDQAVLMYDMLKEIDAIFDEEGLVLVEADIKDLKVKLGESPIHSDKFLESQKKRIKKAEK